jgi:regulator of extracellular matrix RemA (YlzA/DUF370 family)
LGGLVERLGALTCMGKRPCQEKKNAAQVVGLMYHRNTQVMIITLKAVIVLVACPAQRMLSKPRTS